MLSTYRWGPHTDGNWSDASNWLDQNNQHGVPTIDDDATIGFGDINVISDQNNAIRTLNCQATLEITGGTLTITNTTGSSSLGIVLLQNAMLVVNGSTSYSTTVRGAFNNLADGWVKVMSGALTLGNGGMSGVSETTPSTFQVYAGANLYFASVFNSDDTNYSLNAGTVLQGAGAYHVQTFAIASATATVNSDLTVPKLTLDAGSKVTGPGNLTITGELDWTAGTMFGPGTTTIAPRAALNISGSTGETLTGRTLRNSGTAKWTGTGPITLSSDGTSNGTIINDGTWQIQTDAFLGSTGTFNNAGTLTKCSALQGTTTFGCVFNNLAGGSVEVVSGTLMLGNGGTSGGSEASPSVFQVDAGANLTFAIIFRNADSNYTLNAGTALRGAGFFHVQGGGGEGYVTVNTDLTVPNLTLDAGGNITGPGNLTVTGELDWTAGTMSGPGTTTIAAGAALNITGPAGETLDRRTLDNFGTATWTGAGPMAVNNSGTIINNGIWQMQTDAFLGSAGTFNNAGTLTKSSAFQGTTTFGCVFNNLASGSVEVVSGTLMLGNGGTSGGVFQVDTGANLTFAIIFRNADSNYTLNAGTALQGDGFFHVRQAGGGTATVTVNTDLTVPNLTLDAGGILAGPGNLTATGELDWTAGTMSGTGTTTIAAGAALNITDFASKTLGQRTLDNFGTATWTGTGGLTLGSGAVVRNDGSFNIQNDQPVSGLGSIENEGYVVKTSAVGGTTTINVPVYSGGLAAIDVQSGTLDLHGGGISYGGMEVDAPGSLRFTAGTFTLGLGTTEYALSGSGFGRVAGATVNVSGGVVERLALDSGTLTGDGLAEISAAFDWTGGTIKGATFLMALDPDATMTIEGTANKTLDGATLDLNGTVNWSGGNIGFANGATVAVGDGQGGGIFNILSANINLTGMNAGSGMFVNRGEIVKDVSGATQIQSSIGFLMAASSALLNVGNGGLEIDNFTQYAGNTEIASNATLQCSGNTLTLQGGELSGSGTVMVNNGSGTLDNVAGTISPGGDNLSGGDGVLGTLTIAGKYINEALGVVNIDIGDTAPGDYDQLIVTGVVTLNGGTMNVNFLPGYTPTGKDVFRVLLSRQEVINGNPGDFTVYNANGLDPSFQMSDRIHDGILKLKVKADGDGPERDQGSSAAAAVAALVSAVPPPAAEPRDLSTADVKVHPADAYFLVLGEELREIWPNWTV